MWEIIEAEETEKDTIIPMCDMKPMQVGVVVSNINKGNYVMRTATVETFEVIDLNVPGEGIGWFGLEDADGVKVRLLRKGESITVRLFNEV